MEHKEKLTMLRNLMLEAIGEDRTQKQFAEQTGISQTHINRMLNAKTLATPSVQTLKKIADNSEGRVSINQLKDIFGIEHTKTDDMADMKNMPSRKRNMHIADELCRGFCDMSEKPVKYKSLEDICDTIKLLYGYGNTSYQIEENSDENSLLKGKRSEDEYPAAHNNAEEVANIYFEWSDDETTAEWGCTVFYCKTQKGGIWLNDVSFDYETTRAYGNLIAYEMDGMIGEEDPEEISLTLIEKIKNTNIKIAKKTGKDIKTLLASAIVNYAYAVESVLYDKDMNGENEDGKLYEKATALGERISFCHIELMHKLVSIRQDPYTSDREMASLAYAISKIAPEIIKEPLEEDFEFESIENEM